MPERPRTLGEEIANAVSHGVALLAVPVGVPFLIVGVRPRGAASLTGAAVFATRGPARGRRSRAVGTDS